MIGFLNFCTMLFKQDLGGEYVTLQNFGRLDQQLLLFLLQILYSEAEILFLKTNNNFIG